MKLIYPYIILSILVIVNVQSINCQLLVDNHIAYKNNMWYKTTYNYDINSNITNINISKSITKDNWENISYSTLTYTNNLLDERFNYIWINSSWILNSYSKNNYNNQNKILQTIYENHINDSTYREVTDYIYDKDQISSVSKFYINNTPEYTTEILRSYSQNNESEIIISHKDKKQNVIYSEKIRFYYEDELLSEIHRRIFLGNNDSTDYCTKIFYNNNKAQKCEIQYINKFGKLKPLAKHEYLYNSENNLVKIKYSIWNERFWSNTLIKNYYYNEDDNLNRYSVLKPKFHIWKEIFSSSYEYDTSYHIKHVLLENQFWAEQENQYQDFIRINNNLPFKHIFGSEIYFNYRSNIPTDITITNNPINIYPNPSYNGQFYFQTKLDILKVEIYNLQGILVKEINNPYYNLDLQSLQDGIYISKFFSKENSFSTKIIINR